MFWRKIVAAICGSAQMRDFTALMESAFFCKAIRCKHRSPHWQHEETVCSVATLMVGSPCCSTISLAFSKFRAPFHKAGSTHYTGGKAVFGPVPSLTAHSLL